MVTTQAFLQSDHVTEDMGGHLQLPQTCPVSGSWPTSQHLGEVPFKHLLRFLWSQEESVAPRDSGMCLRVAHLSPPERAATPGFLPQPTLMAQGGGDREPASAGKQLPPLGLGALRRRPLAVTDRWPGPRRQRAACVLTGSGLHGRPGQGPRLPSKDDKAELRCHERPPPHIPNRRYRVFTGDNCALHRHETWRRETCIWKERVGSGLRQCFLGKSKAVETALYSKYKEGSLSKQRHGAHQRHCSQVFGKGDAWIRMLTDEKNTFNCYSRMILVR